GAEENRGQENRGQTPFPLSGRSRPREIGVRPRFCSSREIGVRPRFRTPFPLFGKAGRTSYALRKNGEEGKRGQAHSRSPMPQGRRKKTPFHSVVSRELALVGVPVLFAPLVAIATRLQP